ncbi:hypothetical protein, partial [Mycoplasmopsis bovis]|uniref:hypothetical protein n=1 Tax=Mycoplasmopsis bovis TaxID=28903 RepID=UPI003D2C5BCC
RTTGQHPGGIIIIPKQFDIFDFTPINYPANAHWFSWTKKFYNILIILGNVININTSVLL